MKNREAESRETILRVVAEVSQIVTEMSGVQLGERQADMVENRLHGRLRRLNLTCFGDYLEHLKMHRESESQALLSLLTTHHTFFFREFVHFDFLINKGLEMLIERARSRGDRKIRIWSAACSRGQEVYSLAMLLDFHLKELAPDVDFEVWGTDVDPESVAYAQNGVYRVEELKQVPAMYAANNWIRGRGKLRDFAKVTDDLRGKTHFSTNNILDSKTPFKDRFDVIFCRNVFIYFTREQIKECAHNMMKNLDEDGFFVLGVSESFNGLQLGLETVAPSVHRLQRDRKPTAAPVETSPAAPLRVLCVDDSSAILTLMKKILVPEHGFECVATAANGAEALQWLKANRHRIDAVTLDIHMPEMDGIGFLEATKQIDRPPVLVVSSVDRDDPVLGRKVITLGAFDYVEKPSFENLAQGGNEIRAKLRLATRKTAATRPASSYFPLHAPLVTSALKKKKVLIVDDSPTIRQLLKTILNEDPELEVVAEAEKPSEVEALIVKHSPQVITLDIQMPEMNGVELLKIIQPKHRIPIVMISSISREEGPMVLQALENGAIDYIQKPSLKDLHQVAGDIRERVKAAATARHSFSPRPVRKNRVLGSFDKECVILLGASTGGTEALRYVLQGFPAEIPPVVIVQHIPPVFSAAFAQRLNTLCPFEVKEAADGDEVRHNRVLIAPGGKQMAVVRRGNGLQIQVTDAPPMNRHKPSVDYLFQSAAAIERFNFVAALLTGMGADGARGLKALRDRGARTIAQNEVSCIVYGMPREAVAIGGAEFVLHLDDISEKLLRLATAGDSAKKTKAS